LYLDRLPTASCSVDEKSQVQAVDHTQPGLPMKKGRAGTMTHDYIRHGTTTLFAAVWRAIGNRVLIVKLGALGDVVRAAALLPFIRELHSLAHVTWLLGARG
jgi:hypothetical protein